MHASSSSKKQAALIVDLEREIEELQQEFGEREDPKDIVSGHIKLLHKYNEAKDAAQILIGKLAAHKEMTIRQLHQEYGLTDDD